jgi:hypothetical protein
MIPSLETWSSNKRLMAIDVYLFPVVSFLLLQRTPLFDNMHGVYSTNQPCGPHESSPVKTKHHTRFSAFGKSIMPCSTIVRIMNMNNDGLERLTGRAYVCNGDFRLISDPKYGQA